MTSSVTKKRRRQVLKFNRRHLAQVRMMPTETSLPRALLWIITAQMRQILGPQPQQAILGDCKMAQAGRIKSNTQMQQMRLEARI